jgi:hypothetical protein
MGAKNLGILLRILQNVIEKSFINWRVLSLVKINTRISETPCIFFVFFLLQSALLFHFTSLVTTKTLKNVVIVQRIYPGLFYVFVKIFELR